MAIQRCGSVCVIVAIAGAAALSAPAVEERVLSPMIAGANQQFHMAGTYYGTLPADHPQSRRAEFLRILRQTGIRVIRFPGGTLANLYLHGHDPTMRKILGLTSWPDKERGAFTNPWHFLDFCREAKIVPIYQLNMMLHAEGDKVYALAATEKEPWNGPKVALDPTKRAAAAEAVTSLVKEVIERGHRIRHWELGNEEYGHPRIRPEDYADLVVRFVAAIRKADRDAQIWVTLCDNALRRPEGDYARWADQLLNHLQRTDLVKDRHLGFTLHYSWRSIVDLAEKLVRRHGLAPRFAITEFHMAGDGEYWDLSPRFGYALALAKYLIAMATDPRVEILCIHDLVSQNFGIIHYNQRSYGPPDMRTWDPKLGYQPMPAAHAYSLLTRLIGGRYAPDTMVGPDFLIVAKGGRRHIFAVNDGGKAKRVRWHRKLVGPRAKRFESTILLPNMDGAADPRRADRVVWQTARGDVPQKGLELCQPPYSITYCVCVP